MRLVTSMLLVEESLPNVLKTVVALVFRFLMSQPELDSSNSTLTVTLPIHHLPVWEPLDVNSVSTHLVLDQMLEMHLSVKDLLLPQALHHPHHPLHPLHPHHLLVLKLELLLPLDLKLELLPLELQLELVLEEPYVPVNHVVLPIKIQTQLSELVSCNLFPVV